MKHSAQMHFPQNLSSFQKKPYLSTMEKRMKKPVFAIYKLGDEPKG